VKILKQFTLVWSFLWLSFALLEAEELWTLEKCLEYAYQNSPLLKSAYQSVEEAEGQAQAASAILYPQLFFNTSYTKNSPAPFGGFGGTIPTDRIRPSLISSEVYEYALALNYTFFSWRIKPSLDIASANLDRTLSDFRQVKQNLTLQVKKAYYSLLLAEQLVNISKKAEEVAKDNYETTQKLYNEGKVSHFDVSRTRVRWVNSQSDLIEVKNNHNLAREGLRTILSLPPEQKLEVAGQLPEETGQIDLQEALETAFSKRPELQSLGYLENLSASTVSLEKAARLPSFALTYNYSWQGQDLYSNPDKYYKSWTFLGRISVPIFDGFTAKGKIKAARANLEKVQESKQQLQDLINLEVTEAYLTLQAAQERINAQKENIKTAQENLRIATERYKLGLLSQLELKDAELSLIEAETSYSRALYDYSVGLAALQKAQGLD